MRVLALAAVMGAGLSFAGAAFADPYTDPNGRITFEAPRGWTVERQGSASQTAVLLFNASNDCYVFGAPNAVTAPASPDAVIRTTSQPLAATSWTATANSVRDFFPNNSAQLTSQTVDTSGFWPVQRAQFAGVGGKTVYAGMSSRGKRRRRNKPLSARRRRTPTQPLRRPSNRAKAKRSKKPTATSPAPAGTRARAVRGTNKRLPFISVNTWLSSCLRAIHDDGSHP